MTEHQDGKIPLPSGGWVELRDPMTLRAKDRDAVLGNVPLDESKPMQFALDVIHGLAAMMVVNWEIPYLPDTPLPINDPAVLGELTLPDDDRLKELLQPARALLFPKDVSPDQHEDPTSPSGPASG